MNMDPRLIDKIANIIRADSERYAASLVAERIAAEIGISDWLADIYTIAFNQGVDANAHR